MKRILALLCVMVLCFCLTACSNNTSSNQKQSTTSTTKSQSTTKQDGLSDSKIESITVNKLLELIKKKYPVADAGSSTYSINKVTRDRKGDYIVTGTVRLYDKYGKLTTGYYDGSGSYTKSFEIKINGELGYAYAGGEIK